MTKILFTSHNIASKNIADAIIARSLKVKNESYNYELIDTGVPSILDVPTDFNDELLVVLSTHKSKNPQTIFTAHYPGNWNVADFGGDDKTLNTAYASKLKAILMNVNEINKRENFGWNVSLEADHHGPTCSVPIIFAEIGSEEAQWKDKKAGAIMAEAVLEAIKSEKKFETVFCVGEGHYPKTFNKIELESEYAIGHILPKYQIENLDEKLFEQAIKKNVEPVKKVFVVKDSLNVKQKEKIKDFCNIFSVEHIEV
ncbi:MAG: D-aminoacyl-tRNA deacylase [Candidatus Micrarchaeota archaeon]|nr:D-aminoacyl-tRNA deacylase [Candidatus Micrarchaeota archaeon]